MREIDRIERDAISRALPAARGNVAEAAKRLGLNQATVSRRIESYQLEPG
jgi:transcriptional regulator of acetoin/glycerol metabolism